MRTLEAMEATLDLARAYGLDNQESDIPETDYPHLVSMVVRARAGQFSDGKLGRWLGWMQACVVINSMGDVTLEHMEQLNKSFAD